MTSDGNGCEHESDKAENRNGKEDIHEPVRRITRCMGFVHLIRSAVSIWLDTAAGMIVPEHGGGMNQVRFLREGGFPLDGR